MVEVQVHKYRKTGKRLAVLAALNSAQESLERAARAMEKDSHADHARKTRNVAQSASARRCLMEQQWEMDDAAKHEARKEKAKK
jgi:hypothetical protein